MTTQEINTLIDSAINPSGGDPKIAGPDLNALLKNLATEFNTYTTSSPTEDTSPSLISQHTTFDSQRITGPMQFQTRPSRLAIKVISNVAMIAAQVNYRDTNRDGIWIVGPVRNSLSTGPTDLAEMLQEVLADINAVPNDSLAIAAELILRTQPIDPRLESDFFLFGMRSTDYFGRTDFFRTNYTGPPLGNIINNSQFIDAGAWQIPYSGVQIGGGQAYFIGRTYGDRWSVTYQMLVAQADSYIINMNVQQLDAGALTVRIRDPYNQVILQVSVFAPGENSWECTLGVSGQIEVELFTFDSGMIVSHLFMTPKK
ncbi:MAG: hypothetical protein ACRYG7_08710 [Janthinobacterium lividum]